MQRDEPSCPTAEAIAAEVAKIAAHELTGVPGDPLFVITFTKKESGFEALVRAEGDRERVLVAADCKDLAGAVAAVVALALDPFPADDEPAPPAPVAEPPPPAAAPTPRRRRSLSAPPPVVERARVSLALAARAWAAPGFAPGWPLGAIVEGEVARRGLAFSAGFAGLLPRTVTRAGGDLGTAFAGLRAAACAYPVRSTVSVGACLDVLAGVRSVAGDGYARARATKLATVAPGADVRVRVPIAGGLEVDALAGVLVPVPRERFALAGGSELEAAEIVALNLQLGLRYEFR